MENGLLYILAFSAMAIALFACILPQTPVYADIEGTPTVMLLVAKNEVYDIVNVATTNITSYLTDADTNHTIAFGGWVRMAAYTAGSPMLTLEFWDSYNTRRSIALRYGGGGGYIVNWVGFASYEDSTFEVRNGTLCWIQASGFANSTFSAGAWLNLVGDS